MSDIDDALSTTAPSSRETWFDFGERVIGETHFKDIQRGRAERRDAYDRLMDWAVAMEHEMERLEAERQDCIAARDAAIAIVARSGEIRIKDIAVRLRLTAQRVHAIEREHPHPYHYRRSR